MPEVHQLQPRFKGHSGGDGSPSSSVQTADLPLLGMHCAACANRIETSLKSAPGVADAIVNFATTRATVHYDPAKTNPLILREAVRSAGYDAIVPQPLADAKGGISATDDLHDAEARAREYEYRRQQIRFWIAAALTIPLAILAMGGHLLPQLAPLLNQPWRPWAELVLATPALFWAGSEFFIGARPCRSPPSGRHEYSGGDRHIRRICL